MLPLKIMDFLVYILKTDFWLLRGRNFLSLAAVLLEIGLWPKRVEAFPDCAWERPVALQATEHRWVVGNTVDGAAQRI